MENLAYLCISCGTQFDRDQTQIIKADNHIVCPGCNYAEPAKMFEAGIVDDESAERPVVEASHADIRLPTEGAPLPPDIPGVDNFWALKTPSGVIYHFLLYAHLKEWADSLEDPDALVVSRDRIDWKRYASFKEFQEELEDGTLAYDLATKRDTGEHAAVEDDRGPSLAATAQDGFDSLPMDDLGGSFPGEPLPSVVPRKSSTPPKVSTSTPPAAARSANQFTFKTQELPKSSPFRDVGVFILGILLGGTAVMVLYFMGMLDSITFRL